MKLSALTLVLGFTFSGAAFAAGGIWETSAPWGTIAQTSQYAEWNTFESATVKDTTPDVALSAGTTASLKENTGGAFLTGGNIYSFAVATNFTATLSGSTTGAYDVYLRIGTLGSKVNLSSGLLNGNAANEVLVQKTEVSDFNGNPSYEQEIYWKWTNVTGASLYTFNFGASSSSMSLDQLALATVAVTAVPEPEAYGMMAVGLGLVAFARRRVSKKQA